MATKTVLTAGLALLLAACTSTTPAAQPGTAGTPIPGATATSSPSPLGAPGCRPPSPIGKPPGVPGLEVRGTATRGQLWGLLFLRDTPIRVGDEVKIVWRMTGKGDLRLRVNGPDGTRHRLISGPTPHEGGSNYQRPGEEWGAVYRFTQPGCWTLHAARDDTTGDVWLSVAR